MNEKMKIVLRWVLLIAYGVSLYTTKNVLFQLLLLGAFWAVPGDWKQRKPPVLIKKTIVWALGALICMVFACILEGLHVIPNWVKLVAEVIAFVLSAPVIAWAIYDDYLALRGRGNHDKAQPDAGECLLGGK